MQVCQLRNASFFNSEMRVSSTPKREFCPLRNAHFVNLETAFCQLQNGISSTPKRCFVNSKMRISSTSNCEFQQTPKRTFRPLGNARLVHSEKGILSVR